MLSSLLERPRNTQLLAFLVVLNGHISSNDANVLSGLLIVAGGPTTSTVHVKQTRLTALASTPR